MTQEQKEYEHCLGGRNLNHEKLAKELSERFGSDNIRFQVKQQGVYCLTTLSSLKEQFPIFQSLDRIVREKERMAACY